MKVKLFLVNHEDYEGLYTKAEFDELKEEVIEEYRNDDFGYSRDIHDLAKLTDLVTAALGNKHSQDVIEEIAKECEEQYWEDFCGDFVEEYEKDI